MKKTVKGIPLVCGLLAIGLTVLLFALLVDDLFGVTARWLSVAFVLLAEVLLLVKVLAGGSDIILNVQHIIGVLYVAVTVALALIFVNVDEPDIKALIAWQSILLVVVTVADLAVWYFSRQAAKSDAALAQTQSVVAGCMALAGELAIEYRDTSYAKALTEVEESLRYADNSALSGTEEDITAQLLTLKELLSAETVDDAAVQVQLNGIKTSIKVRSSYIKQAKRGNF